MHKYATIVLLFLFFAYRTLFAQAALEFELNNNPGEADIQKLLAYEGRLYFLADDGCHGLEPWVYDTATDAASLLVDIIPGGGDSYMFAKAGYQEKIFFGGFYGIYRHDPITHQTDKISDLILDGEEMVAIDGKLYFYGKDNSSNIPNLYGVDAQSGSSQALHFSSGVSNNWRPHYFIVHHNELYFSAKNENNLDRLYKYEPATNTLHQLPSPAEITEIGSGNFPLRSMTSCGDLLFISLSGGSPPDPSIYSLSAYNDATDEIQPLGPEYVTSFVNACYDNAFYFMSLGELKKYDNSTGIISGGFDLIPGLTETGVSVKILGGELHAAVHVTGKSYNDLVKWNAGQQIFEHLIPVGPKMSYSALNVAGIEYLGNNYLFPGPTTNDEKELLKYTPGSAEPVLAGDINMASKGVDIRKIAALEGQGYLWANDGDVVRFDISGTPDPVILNDTWGLDMGMELTDLAAANGRVYLGGVKRQDIGYGLATYEPDADSLQYFLEGFAAGAFGFQLFNGDMYFIAGSSAGEDQVFRYDTVQNIVTNVYIGPVTGSPVRLSTNETHLFLFTDIGKLYRFDGVNTLEISIGVGAISPYFKPVLWDQYLFFLQKKQIGNIPANALFRLNLETLEIEQVINSEYGSDNGYSTAVYDNKLWVIKNSMFSQLYRLDLETNTLLLLRTEDGLAGRMADLISFNGQLLLQHYTLDYGWEWYRTDPATAALELLTDINPLSGDGTVGVGTVIGSKLYFAGNDGLHGSELWSYSDCFSAIITSIPSEFGDSTGQISVIISGGAEPFTYEWSNGGNGSSQTNLPTSVYQVTITDANGCKSTLHTCIESVFTITGASEPSTFALTAYPNPFGQWFRLEATTGLDKQYLLQLFDMQGKIMESRNWNTLEPAVFEGARLPAGLYFLILQEKNGAGVKSLKITKRD